MRTSVDSYRFLSGVSRKLIRTRIGLEPPREIPWTPLAKPLSERTVALISSGGIALKQDRPFDQEGERMRVQRWVRSSDPAKQRGCTMDARTKALIAVSASMALNGQVCMTCNLSRAREAGAEEKDIAKDVEAARAVQAGSMKSMDAYLGRSANRQAAPDSAAAAGCSRG